MSDNIPRTDDELREELMNELGLRRRGLRMNLYLNTAISNARREAAKALESGGVESTETKRSKE